MTGVYQHCSEKHLHQYLAEFDFRYSNRVKLGIDDVARAERAIVGVKGKAADILKEAQISATERKNKWKHQSARQKKSIRRKSSGLKLGRPKTWLR